MVSINNKSPVKEGITDERAQATVESGIITKERSVNVDGKNGGNNLGN